MKQRYNIRVRRGTEIIGEYVFNATGSGLRWVIEHVKPEFNFDILGMDGIVYDRGYFSNKIGE